MGWRDEMAGKQVAEGNREQALAALVSNAKEVVASVLNEAMGQIGADRVDLATSSDCATWWLHPKGSKVYEFYVTVTTEHVHAAPDTDHSTPSALLDPDRRDFVTTAGESVDLDEWLGSMVFQWADKHGLLKPRA